MSRYYLGVDGGQSSTVALVADEHGAVLGQGVAGPCNHVTGPAAEEKFNRVVGSCVANACASAGLTWSDVEFEAACFGFSGGIADKQKLARSLIRSRLYKVTHDAEIAWYGATEGEPGIIVIAGTGSMAFGCNASGQTARAGGWGYKFGDEGGAFDLVRQALRASLRYEEGWGPFTSLHESLLNATGCASADELLHVFYAPEYPKDKVAQLAPLVSAAAEAGDSVAQELIGTAANELCGYVQGVFRHLFVKGQIPVVCPIGGVFQGRLLRDRFVRSVRDRLDCPVEQPRQTPAAGALLNALHMTGIRIQLAGEHIGPK